MCLTEKKILAYISEFQIFKLQNIGISIMYQCITVIIPLAAAICEHLLPP